MRQALSLEYKVEEDGKPHAKVYTVYRLLFLSVIPGVLYMTNNRF